MIDLVRLINDYAEYRKLETPDSREALLFLISEIGELAEADLLAQPGDLRGAELLTGMQSLGLLADTQVSLMKKWTRNGNRVKAPNVPAEIADCLMMLTRYAEKSGQPDPLTCLINKMRGYGFNGAVVDILPDTFWPLCPYCSQRLALAAGKITPCACGRNFTISGGPHMLIEVVTPKLD